MPKTIMPRAIAIEGRQAAAVNPKRARGGLPLLSMPLLLLSFLLSFGLSSCRPPAESNFALAAWRGEKLDGDPVIFSELDRAGAMEGLVLNFYSPICQPCIEELPALHRLYERARERNVPLYLAVEQDAEKHGIELPSETAEALGREQRQQERLLRVLLIERLQQDRRKYKINIPFLLMWKDFTIAPQQLVTATPETLFFKTTPLRLVYNFIGALSAAKSDEELDASSRLNFALQQLEKL